MYRYRYVWIALMLILGTWYYFCLPDKLFSDPTCTVLLDRKGNILGARIADDGQWRFPHNAHVPEKFRKAIIQFEDRTFYSHPGISLRGLGRALVQNLGSGRVVSGGSTLTMQMVRMMRKGKSRNLYQKLVESILATRVELSYTKEEILALYASNAPMGGNVVGLDAAAWRYFGRTPDQLSWAEAATLAVLPNAPSLIFPGRNQHRLLEKRNRLLERLYENGDLDSLTLVISRQEPLPSRPPDLPQLAPHLMERMIREGHKGKRLITTIDKNLQEQVIQILSLHHRRLAQNKVFNAACLVADVNTGEVRAYVGNVENEEEEHGSAVDLIKAPRSTGSILKPLLYAGMLHEGEISPRALVADIPTHISGYSPKNYHKRYDGAVPAHRALARSLNVPAVRMLQQYGIARFHYLLKKLGLTTLSFPASHYGLSLVLGGAEANLWDLASVYAGMARSLNQYPDFNANVNQKLSCLPVAESEEAGIPVLNPAASWFTFEAMVEVSRPDAEANWQTFSSSSKIAWKTGTSFGFRDAWAIGTDPRYVVAVWVGNADGEGRPGLTGIDAAAPILFDIFSRLPKGRWFNPPYDEMKEVAICPLSGHRASSLCPPGKAHIPLSSLQTPACPYHQWIHLDPTRTWQVDGNCEPAENIVHEKWFVLPPIIEFYYKGKNPSYRSLPPFRSDCEPEQHSTQMEIIYPRKGSKIYIPVDLDGTRGKAIFEATHRHSSALIYWHIDDTYLGHTEGIHQIELAPAAGSHRLTLIDEEGVTVSQTFEIIDKIQP